jgi:hypothetical protein
LRYYQEGRWTAWVADADVVAQDPDGLPAIRRKRRWVVIGAVLGVAVAAALLVELAVVLNRASLAGIDEVTGEMNRWKLPPTVARSNKGDDVASNFGQSGPTMTRWYDPVSGATPDRALTDLVSALNDQGYDFTPTTPDEGQLPTGKLLPSDESDASRHHGVIWTSIRFPLLSRPMSMKHSFELYRQSVAHNSSFPLNL